MESYSSTTYLSNKHQQRKRKTKKRRRRRRSGVRTKIRSFYSIRVKDNFAISPRVLGVPAKMLGAPSNTLKELILALQNWFGPYCQCANIKILFVSFLFLWFWFWFIFFLSVENTDWLSFSKRRDNSCNLILFFCKSLRGLPQSVCFVWSLENFEWCKWSHLTINQSIEILILGFVHFFLF